MKANDTNELSKTGATTARDILDRVDLIRRNLVTCDVIGCRTVGLYDPDFDGFICPAHLRLLAVRLQQASRDDVKPGGRR